MYKLLRSCSLIKEEIQRPKYNKLLEDKFIRSSDEANVDVAQYVSDVLDLMANNGATAFTMNQPWWHSSAVINIKIWWNHYPQPTCFPSIKNRLEHRWGWLCTIKTWSILQVFWLFSIAGAFSLSWAVEMFCYEVKRSLSKAFQWREWWYEGTSQHRWSACSILYVSCPRFFLTKLNFFRSFTLTQCSGHAVGKMGESWISLVWQGSLTSLFHWSHL